MGGRGCRGAGELPPRDKSNFGVSEVVVEGAAVVEGAVAGAGGLAVSVSAVWGVWALLRLVPRTEDRFGGVGGV